MTGEHSSDFFSFTWVRKGGFWEMRPRWETPQTASLLIHTRRNLVLLDAGFTTFRPKSRFCNLGVLEGGRSIRASWIFSKSRRLWVFWGFFPNWFQLPDWYGFISAQDTSKGRKTRNFRKIFRQKILGGLGVPHPPNLVWDYKGEYGVIRRGIFVKKKISWNIKKNTRLWELDPSSTSYMPPPKKQGDPKYTGFFLIRPAAQKKIFF